MQNVDSMTFSSLNVGIMIETILGPRTAQGVFAQSPAPRLSEKTSHPLGRGSDATCSATMPPDKVCISASAVGNLSQRTNIVAVT